MSSEPQTKTPAPPDSTTTMPAADIGAAALYIVAALSVLNHFFPRKR